VRKANENGMVRGRTAALNLFQASISTMGHVQSLRKARGTEIILNKVAIRP